MTVTEKDSGRVVKGAEERVLPEAEGWGWTVSQRVGLGVMVVLLIGFLGWQWWRRPAVLGIGSVVVDGEVVGLPVRVDPNVATEKELARIPHLGEKMAGKIVLFREQHREAEGVVFRRVEDLGRVEGIGKGMVELLRPYLEVGEEEREGGTAGTNGG